MEDFIKIEDYMAGGADSRIARHRKSPILALAILAVGIVLLAVSLRFKLADSLQMALLTLGIMGILAGGIMLLLSNGQCYRYQPTGAQMRHYRRYVNTDDRQKLIDSIEKGDLGQLAQIRKESSTGTLLNAFVCADGSFAVVQAEVYIPHDFLPATPPVAIGQPHSAALLKWLE